MIYKAVGTVGEFEQASKIYSQANGGPILSSVQKPLVTGFLKTNTDAAFASTGVGLGGVTRDSMGDVLVATCKVVKGDCNVEMAEAMALRHALKINIEAGFIRLMMEVDNMKLFNHLTKGIKESTSFGGVINDICFLCSLCQEYDFSFVKHEGNCVAHIYPC